MWTESERVGPEKVGENEAFVFREPTTYTRFCVSHSVRDAEEADE